MFKISLSKSEYTYLCQAAFIQKMDRESLFSAQQPSGDHLINVSEDQANKIQDLCGEQLQIVGFDEKYELTPEGEILESLVDKFFIGEIGVESLQGLFEVMMPEYSESRQCPVLEVD